MMLEKIERPYQKIDANLIIAYAPVSTRTPLNNTLMGVGASE
jgi:hypothetical protein